MGAHAVHHLLTTPRASVYVAASSREQASIIFAYARDFAIAADAGIVLRHLELRAPDGGLLKVLASDAPKLHGLTPSLAIVDEYHAHQDDAVYLALKTAQLKRPGSRLVTVSTAGQGTDSPLGRLRARALAQPHVARRGPVTHARGQDLAMLEWAVPEGANADDPRAVKRANPASWITVDALRSQRESVPDLAFRQLHANQWVARAGHWLPAGAWQCCVDPDLTIEPGERIWVGVDAGGARAATAVVWATEDLRVGAWIGHGDDAILEAVDRIRDLANTYTVAEVIYDPWRMQQAALELERDGLVVVTFPQSDSRMVPASTALHEAIVQRRLHLPDHDELAQHAANAVQRHSRRGWRLDTPARGVLIDGIVALAMAVDRAAHREPETQLVGWL